MFSGIIYKIVSPEMSYVGQTVKRLRQRWTNHVSDARHLNYPLHRAIRKFGRDQFSKEILAVIYAKDESELYRRLNNAEKELIVAHETRFPNGYNLTDGGDGRGPASDLVKRTLAENNKRRVFTPELLEKMRIAATGYQHSPEARLKMSLARRGKPKSEEHKRKISAGHLAYHARKRNEAANG